MRKILSSSNFYSYVHTVQYVFQPKLFIEGGMNKQKKSFTYLDTSRAIFLPREDSN